MRVTDIMIWRDGGTISFVLDGSTMAGRYRLQAAWHGEPRPFFRDDQQLPCGGPEERAVTVELRAWLEASMTTEIAKALDRLDSLREWRNLPTELDKAVPFHWIRGVIDCLEARSAP